MEEEKNTFQYIDPVAQVFMDFYSYLQQPNENGETELIIYQEWADKARTAMSEEINARYDLVPKDNDELKDLGHVKEDFLK